MFDLVQDFSAAIANLPPMRPTCKLVKLLEQAIRYDIQFVSRHPTTLFQCVWNSGWWYDCPEAAKFYEPPISGWPPEGPPWERPRTERLSILLESWRAEKEQRIPGFVWLRSLRPPRMPLGTGLIARLLVGNKGMVYSVAFSSDVDVHTPKANVQCTTLDRKPLKSVRNRHQTNTILNTLHEPKSTTVLELKYRSYEMFTIIQEFTEKYRGFRGSLFSIHPLSGCERLPSDGRRIVSGASDKMVRAWDAETGKELACFTGHEGWVISVAFSPDGRFITC